MECANPIPLLKKNRKKPQNAVIRKPRKRREERKPHHAVAPKVKTCIEQADPSADGSRNEKGEQNPVLGSLIPSPQILDFLLKS